MRVDHFLQNDHHMRRSLVIYVFVGLVVGGVVLTIFAFRIRSKYLVGEYAYNAWLVGGHEALRESRYDEAHKRFSEAVQMNPTRYEAYLSLAELELRLGKTNHALEALNLALRYVGRSPTNFMPLKLQSVDRMLIEQRLRDIQGHATEGERH